jgi:cytochrome P450
MKSYQLHSAQDRHAVFAALAPRVWREDDLLRMWVVADPQVIQQILRSPEAALLDLGEILAAVKAKFGVELANVEYACKVLPVLVHEDVHPSIRRQFAAFLSGRLAELDAQLPGIVESSLAPLRSKGKVEIIGQVVNPLIQRVFSIFLKSDMPAEFLTLHVTEILSFKAMVTYLKKLDARIAIVLSYLRATTTDEEEVGWKFTCLVFGLHTVTMMLAESLVTALRTCDGSGRTAAKLPDFPVETGVPVSHRRARTDFKIEGHKFQAGDFIRLQMQALGYSPVSEDRKFIFGAGAHTCLGKHVSLRIWDAFRREFDAIGLRARITDYKLLPSHYIIFHDSIEIEVL